MYILKYRLDTKKFIEEKLIEIINYTHIEYIEHLKSTILIIFLLVPLITGQMNAFSNGLTPWAI